MYDYAKKKRNLYHNTSLAWAWCTASQKQNNCVKGMHSLISFIFFLSTFLDKTTTIYLKISSVIMSTMDRKTVEISKPEEILFQDTPRPLFNTNNMSIMVVSWVSLILIMFMIVSAYVNWYVKHIKKRRILNFHNIDIR